MRPYGQPSQRQRYLKTVAISEEDTEAGRDHHIANRDDRMRGIRLHLFDERLHLFDLKDLGKILNLHRQPLRCRPSTS